MHRRVNVIDSDVPFNSNVIGPAFSSAAARAGPFNADPSKTASDTLSTLSNRGGEGEEFFCKLIVSREGRAT